MKPRISLLIIALAGAPLPALAEAPRVTTTAAELTVTRAQLTVADVVKDAPLAARDVELGPAPSPGASRVVSRDEILRSLRRAGKTTAFAVPAATRVTRASEHIASRALADLARPAIVAELPFGVTLVHAEATSDFTAPAGTHVGRATLPKIPKTKGPFHTTANVELVNDDLRIAQIPIAVVVDVSEAGAAHDVKKGAHISVVVERATLTVSTDATVTKDADIGEATTVTLDATGHTAHVKLLSKTRAELVEAVK